MNKKTFKIIGFIIIMAVVIFGLMIVQKIYTPNTNLDFSDHVVIKIPQGASSGKIAQILSEKELIQNPFLFKAVARIYGHSQSLRAGRHVIRRPMSIYELSSVLSKSGGSFDIKVTIPEGWTIYQIADILENEMGIDSTEFYEVVYSEKLLDSLGLQVPTFEGFLYPETYLFPETYSAKDVILDMYSHFKKMWSTKKDMARKYDRPMEEIVTLASIIEAEATTASERRTISSVYNNRLEKGMLLQADPTTIYGIRKFDTPLTLKDLRDGSEYNTYVHPGLPPGPICNPSEACIDAAMNPKETPYLYFVARYDGTHVFSKTLKEHHAAIHRIRD